MPLSFTLTQHVSAEGKKGYCKTVYAIFGFTKKWGNYLCHVWGWSLVHDFSCCPLFALFSSCLWCIWRRLLWGILRRRFLGLLLLGPFLVSPMFLFWLLCSLLVSPAFLGFFCFPHSCFYTFFTIYCNILILYIVSWDFFIIIKN